ncbi:Transposon Tf2-11 polyprotein [Labeo rohita]|uniref:Transposon Tf2-11 polyprotein n=1 Tax=Labeo rohita TaxID=84645 RepID=A0ABQ8MHC3_LABRO|nr:Transposon Tf2-11 polyprotein [Labeo rohita]
MEHANTARASLTRIKSVRLDASVFNSAHDCSRLLSLIAVCSRCSQDLLAESVGCSRIAIASRGVGAASSRTKFLTGMHCFKSEFERAAQRCVKSHTPRSSQSTIERAAPVGLTDVSAARKKHCYCICPWSKQAKQNCPAQPSPSRNCGLGCLIAFAHQPLLNPTIKPVIQPLQRIPLALHDSVSAELKQLLDIAINEPVDATPWVLNLVVAQKKSGALRVCVDLQAVIPDRFPLPTSEELIALFHGSTVFSKLDLRQGYLQVLLHPSSRNLTAFVTHAGVFRYTRSRDECLSRVFAALAEHKLTLNAEKCVFSVPTIEYVGFWLSADGVTPLRSNIDAILAISKPSSAAQVTSFLGMTGYYLKFLPHYSATTVPLRRLLRKDEPWVWSQACSDAVRALKVQLTTAPVLAHFDISSPTWVTCDVSATAIGTVLSQTQRGVEKPIAFASRALNQTEQRFGGGTTDHQALTALLSTSGSGHRPLRLQHWSDHLRQYNFDLKFTPGRDNVVADLLSRSNPPHPNTPIHTVTDQVERDIVQMLHAPLQAVISLQQLKEASEQDPVLSQLRVYVLNGSPQELDICVEIQGVPHHQRFLVVVYDLHSKWPELIATDSVTSQVILNFLDSLFSRWGLPNTITTDNGLQLILAEFTTYLKNKSIHHIRTAYYHPQANGGIERFHQSLKNSLRAHLFQGWSFSQAIHHTLLHYRATQHSTTGVSPAFLMLGRKLHLPLDRPSPALPQEPLQRVRASVTCQQRRMKQKFDLSTRVKVPDIKAADWVRVRRPHRDNELASYWSAPLQVIHQLGPATFLLSDGTR